MSFDLYAWYDPEGRQRGREEEQRAFIDNFEETPPGPQVAAFVAECERRWNWDDPDDETQPWATWPLSSQANGDGVALNFRWSATDVVPQVIAVAHTFGLTAYDPQAEVAHPPGAGADSVAGSGKRPGLFGRFRRG